ncbi:MAG: ribonuclease J [Thermoleophilaceae bacterium]|nr:ribonuclease J [Thermoleophilaceae bacterium]
MSEVRTETLRVLPLGGLGEIGKNMTIFEYDGSIVIVDTGLMFPTADMLGIDLVLPDFHYLRDRADDVVAIVITHGHEDHVGALPYVIRELFPDSAPPIYASPLTAAMAESKLDEHKLRHVKVIPTDTGEVLEAGPFDLELLHVSHSIPDACAVAITCDLGTTLLTGDYKFDQTPVDGQPTDMSRLAELGSEGLLLLCGDSTNADRPGISPSESSIGPHLEQAIGRCEGRVLVTSFASNIHRIQQVIDGAVAHDRKVALVGRSMRRNFAIGKRLGHIFATDDLMIQPKQIEDYPDEKVVVICTGSQGEPLSALRRMAQNDHPQISLHNGDTVIFSASPVPGNERAVNETIDRLFHIGTSVITAQDAPIHASGHGYADELKLMINLTRPRYVMPVHGDFKRIRLHAQLAESVGIDPEDIFSMENGMPLEINAKGARIGDRVKSGRLFVDGLEVGDLEDVALRDRRMLSSDGIFIVVATVSERTGTQIAEPELLFRGVPFLDEADELLEELRATVEDSIDSVSRRVTEDDEFLESELRKQLHDDVARFVYDRLRRRPMVLPVVVEV